MPCEPHLRLTMWLVTLLVLGACAPAEQPRGETTVSSEEIFETRCGICHGSTGSGNTPTAGGYPNANLIDQTWAHGSSKEQIAHTISAGVRGTPMRGYAGIMSHEEIDALALYVQSLSR